MTYAHHRASRPTAETSTAPKRHAARRCRPSAPQLRAPLSTTELQSEASGGHTWRKAVGVTGCSCEVTVADRLPVTAAPLAASTAWVETTWPIATVGSSPKITWKTSPSLSHAQDGKLPILKWEMKKPCHHNSEVAEAK